jgi:hypothetical protein
LKFCVSTHFERLEKSHIFAVVVFPKLCGRRCRLAGGNLNNGTNAGAAATNSNNAVANANANVSSPQCLNEGKYRAAWQKTTILDGCW